MLTEIKQLRKLTGLSQAKFADKYHLNVYTLQEWEQGRQRPPTAILYLLERIIKEVDFKEGEKEHEQEQ